jgi:hypothetical protein
MAGAYPEDSMSAIGKLLVCNKETTTTSKTTATNNAAENRFFKPHPSILFSPQTQINLLSNTEISFSFPSKPNNSL